VLTAPASIAVEALSSARRGLWDQVCRLWAQSRSRDREAIRAAIHPNYVGWDMSAELPHDREAAVGSVSGDAPELMDYTLFPHSVQIYDRRVGVVHYSYRATVQPRAAESLEVTGKWTEVYLKEGSHWAMVAVSGRPDPRPGGRLPPVETAA
jgi:hypothetical protein